MSKKKLISFAMTLIMLLSCMITVSAAPTWTGKFSDLSGYTNGYVGENYAMTTFTKTNGTESVAGVDYKASSGAPFNADGSFTMVVGDWGKYEITVPYTGVYAFQIKTLWISGNQTTTFKVSTEDGYYTEQSIWQTGWTSGSYADQPIYLKEGKNTIKVELVGPNNCIFAAIDLGKLDAKGAASSLDFLELVKVESSTEPEATPTPTTAPTTTPEPTSAPTPTYVPGDADEWTGRFGDLESHKNGYLGEIYTMTTFTKTNGTESVAGVDYKASSGAPFNGGQFTMITGDWGKYEVEVPYTGVYAMQIQLGWIGGSGNTKLMVSADSGYYSIHNIMHATWSSGSYADRPIFLTEGKNVITIKVIDGNNCILTGIDLGRLDKNGAAASLNYLPLVSVKEDKFTDLKINTATGTASVTYQKFYDDDTAMLVLGEYETYDKLANVNLTQINTENQEINSFETYSISIANPKGDLKAMLLDNTLKPVITESVSKEITRFTGKKISILGDSISTFKGYSNNTNYNSTLGDNIVYYDGSYMGFFDVNETWWMQTIDALGMELCVDNAYSGDRVCTHGISRALQLHNNEGENPDVIVVFLGVNDLIGGCSASKFETNYNIMISGMRAKYPDAEIYLMSFPYYENSLITSYCDIIEETAATYNCTFVDLYRDAGINSSNVANYMVDGFLHPNYAGMDKISECLVNAMLAE